MNYETTLNIYDGNKTKLIYLDIDGTLFNQSRTIISIHKPVDLHVVIFNRPSAYQSIIMYVVPIKNVSNVLTDPDQ